MKLSTMCFLRSTRREYADGGDKSRIGYSDVSFYQKQG